MNEALTLLGSGMITIFVILSLVVFMGNGLIRLVNRFSNQPVTAKGNITDHSIQSETLAAIVAAVDLTTQGKGRVVSVEKN
ncbi:MAG: oxaloacetate decarboxylase [Bacteroidota bacterium]